jgi:hypothetical protein
MGVSECQIPVASLGSLWTFICFRIMHTSSGAVPLHSISWLLIFDNQYIPHPSLTPAADTRLRE